MILRRGYLTFASDSGRRNDTLRAALTAVSHKQKLQQIYKPVLGGLKPGMLEYDKRARSARGFLLKYPLFTVSEVERAYINRNREKLVNLQQQRDRIKVPPMQEMKLLQIQLVHQSSVIEGNRLKVGDSEIVYQLTKDGAELNEMLPRLTTDLPTDELRASVVDVRNHFRALDYTMSQISVDKLSEQQIQELHRMLFKDTPQEKAFYWGQLCQAGDYRLLTMRSYGYDTVFPGPLEVPFLMNRLIAWHHDRLLSLPDVIHCCQLFLKFLHIHPFMDGNGRIARLLLTAALQHHGYPPVVFYDSQKLVRNQYLDSIADAHEGQPGAFYDLVLRVLEDAYLAYSK